MLRFVEEILLLLIHDDGRTTHVPSWVLDYAVAGGVLMDLALENRIDTDPQRLILVDSAPIGDNILDPALAEIAAGDPHDTRFWLDHLAQNSQSIRDKALARLVEHGILEQSGGTLPVGVPRPPLPHHRRQGRTGSQDAPPARALLR